MLEFRHALGGRLLGGDYLRARSSSDAAAQRFAYTFLGIADLQQGRVRQVLVTDYAAAAAQREAFAMFAQDQIRVGPRLSVNVGARYHPARADQPQRSASNPRHVRDVAELRAARG
jgi:outer membrane receptor protein involved in Fe transport